jgi:NAD(P)-dependent dehydrogenase (short-subunit alcohol dehydrogenase family)
MPRRLEDQVVVIVGASSGIGREAALRFAAAGARVVVAARNARALDLLASDIRSHGGQALAVPTDATDPEAVERLAEAAVEAFGRIDTWVNNAAIGHYGTIEETPLEEMRRVFDTDYWGMVHGVKAALPHMKASGGVIVTVGSVVSDFPVPLQASYVAAKHAMKGFLGALRIELMHDRVPVQVVLIKPPSVDTPFFENARTRMVVAPKHIPPLYDPAVIARAIVHAAEHPRREVAVGGVAKLLGLNHALSPARFERKLSVNGYAAQLSDDPKATGEDDTMLHAEAGPGRVRSRGNGWRTSWVMWLEEHPRATAAAGLALTGAAIATASRATRR